MRTSFAAAALISLGLAGTAQAQAAKPAGAMPVGNAARGQAAFAPCKTCHVVEPGKNKVGPSLHGIVGRKSGTVPNYNYSAANKKAAIVWTPTVLFAYLDNPRKYLPGTKMAYAGLKDPQKRADLIAWLGTKK